ncbi:hypothetical protein [Amycolatopsis echigonensis]|uniref:Uncharacterized protein n=1 Tax=Amycolatopsis echigonensis TaxID=2576905 RepID=A0A2N3WEA6_9PSEU|nr:MULTISPECIES: hypothetical protein [Amycolatopsis]MBB2499657.1 hypothetical protein [Amycolatopsis echigonensis]PKV92185.1 hypothetical protein ATK30_2980 [Amycolatopsis niigatensis]
MKIAAFIVFAISAWLAYGAWSLHEKDPAHYTSTPMLALGAIAAVSLAVVLFGKSKAAKSRS